MTGYLQQLVNRTLGVVPALAPRPRSAFEPAPGAGFDTWSGAGFDGWSDGGFDGWSGGGDAGPVSADDDAPWTVPTAASAGRSTGRIGPVAQAAPAPAIVGPFPAAASTVEPPPVVAPPDAEQAATSHAAVVEGAVDTAGGPNAPAPRQPVAAQEPEAGRPSSDQELVSGAQPAAERRSTTPPARGVRDRRAAAGNESAAQLDGGAEPAGSAAPLGPERSALLTVVTSAAPTAPVVPTARVTPGAPVASDASEPVGAPVVSVSRPGVPPAPRRGVAHPPEAVPIAPGALARPDESARSPVRPRRDDPAATEAEPTARITPAGVAPGRPDLPPGEAERSTPPAGPDEVSHHTPVTAGRTVTPAAPTAGRATRGAVAVPRPASPPPRITVNIGRVELRPPPLAAPPQAPPVPEPVSEVRPLSLGEYLDRRA